MPWQAGVVGWVPFDGNGREGPRMFTNVEAKGDGKAEEGEFRACKMTGFWAFLIAHGFHL